MSSGFLDAGLFTQLQNVESSAASVLVEAAIKLFSLHELDAFIIVDLPIGQRVWAGQKQLRYKGHEGGGDPNSWLAIAEVGSYIDVFVRRYFQVSTQFTCCCCAGKSCRV